MSEIDAVENLLQSYWPLESEYFKGSWFYVYVLKNPFVRYFISFLTMIYTFVFVRPLATIYFKGPNIHGFGMWGGVNLVDICCQISDVPSAHWQQFPEECSALVEKRFFSFLITVQCIIIFAVLCRIGNYFWYRWFIVPVELEKEFKLIEKRAACMWQYAERLDQQPMQSIDKPTSTNSTSTVHEKCTDVASGAKQNEDKTKDGTLTKLKHRLLYYCCNDH